MLVQITKGAVQPRFAAIGKTAPSFSIQSERLLDRPKLSRRQPPQVKTLPTTEASWITVVCLGDSIEASRR